MVLLSWLLGCLYHTTLVSGAVTVYGQQAYHFLTETATSSGSAAAATYTGAAAYDPTILNAPPVPSPAPPTQFSLQLSNSVVPGVSIPQSGSFFGFSIEFSVINQVREYRFDVLSI